MGRYINILKKFLKASMGLLVILGYTLNVQGSELIKGYATAYTADKDAITYSGEKPKEGGCAGSKEYVGKIIMIYQRLPDDNIGDLIGTYECNDTGGTKGIKNGIVIDVYKENIEKCQEFMDSVYKDGCQGKVFIQISEKN